MTRSAISLRQRSAGRRRSRGVAAVEFMIMAPVLFLVGLMAVELGRAFVQYDTLSYSVRNAARFVTVNAIEGTTGVVNITPAVAAQARNLAVYGNAAGAGNPRLPGFRTNQVTVVDAGGSNIEVTAAYPYQPIIGAVLPVFGSEPVPLTFTMRIALTMRAIS
jgi:Flp pilus assembly protein TadG